MYGCCIRDFTEEKFSDLRRVVKASWAIVNRDTNLGWIQRTESWVWYRGREAGDEALVKIMQDLGGQVKEGELIVKGQYMSILRDLWRWSGVWETTSKCGTATGICYAMNDVLWNWMYNHIGISLVVQWLRLCTPSACGTSLIYGWGNKSPHSTWCGKIKKKKILWIFKTKVGFQRHFPCAVSCSSIRKRSEVVHSRMALGID